MSAVTNNRDQAPQYTNQDTNQAARNPLNANLSVPKTEKNAGTNVVPRLLFIALSSILVADFVSKYVTNGILQNRQFNTDVSNCETNLPDFSKQCEAIIQQVWDNKKAGLPPEQAWAPYNALVFQSDIIVCENNLPGYPNCTGVIQDAWTKRKAGEKPEKVYENLKKLIDHWGFCRSSLPLDDEYCKEIFADVFKNGDDPSDATLRKYHTLIECRQNLPGNTNCTGIIKDLLDKLEQGVPRDEASAPYDALILERYTNACNDHLTNSNCSIVAKNILGKLKDGESPKDVNKDFEILKANQFYFDAVTTLEIKPNATDAEAKEAIEKLLSRFNNKERQLTVRTEEFLKCSRVLQPYKDAAETLGIEFGADLSAASKAKVNLSIKYRNGTTTTNDKMVEINTAFDLYKKYKQIMQDLDSTPTTDDESEMDL